MTTTAEEIVAQPAKAKSRDEWTNDPPRFTRDHLDYLRAIFGDGTMKIKSVPHTQDDLVRVAVEFTQFFAQAKVVDHIAALIVAQEDKAHR